MAYADKDDLLAAAGGPERLKQLADREPSKDYWIGKALAWGDALINLYLPPRFRTPLSSAGDAIRHIAAEEGIYRLTKAHGMAIQDEHDAAAERVQRVKDIRDGKAWPAHELPEPTRGRQSAFVESERPTTLKKLKGFV